MKKLFIDKNVKVIKGSRAKSLIISKNDSAYIQDDAILKVDRERWNDAQSYERKTWMELGLKSADDRNYEHFKRFDSFNSLKEYQKENKINKVIELGCGPFTNMRTLLSQLPNLKEIHLLDPLLNDYLKHPNCQYSTGQLDKFKTVLHAIPIEELETNEVFDLVVMINVLEHCYDITIIFEKILSIMTCGSVFVFSDVYYFENDVKKMVYEIYDAGHPIKLTFNYMNQFLSRFKKIFECELHGLYGQPWRHDKYFIGVK
ncbi:MAG: class I SAM-dependent methyltransferase [Ignavibacteriaceae bacterium]|nr:class I SAM-dependent methyltransferase [Ignavibacteriaceae bacterium]